MKNLLIISTLFLLASCQKEDCGKSIFFPYGRAVTDCSLAPAGTDSTVIVTVEQTTVCACLLSYREQPVPPGELANFQPALIRHGVLSDADNISNDSARIETKAIFTAFFPYLDCSTF